MVSDDTDGILTACTPTALAATPTKDNAEQLIEAIVIMVKRYRPVDAAMIASLKIYLDSFGHLVKRIQPLDVIIEAAAANAFEENLLKSFPTLKDRFVHVLMENAEHPKPQLFQDIDKMVVADIKKRLEADLKRAIDQNSNLEELYQATAWELFALRKESCDAAGN
ncbi:hypothetical protein DFJ73DRAFT_794847 [Zopfochytrium polystomum]|nr:hypothetical protein DFJ73DRAFT_794847 [Zopfochytrium polystomum]